MCTVWATGGMSKAAGSGQGPFMRAPSREQGRPGAPVGHGAFLSDGVAPHGEAHAHDGAGDEDEEDDGGADQQVQEGTQEGAAGGRAGGHWHRPGGTQPWEGCPHPQVSSGGRGGCPSPCRPSCWPRLPTHPPKDPRGGTFVPTSHRGGGATT